MGRGVGGEKPHTAPCTHTQAHTEERTPRRRLWAPPPAMGIQGMELCAVAVVILLFIAVLKQFGILEPISVEGNPVSVTPLPFINFN